MPYGLCPMVYALCPVVPHLSEKGYISISEPSRYPSAEEIQKSAETGDRIKSIDNSPGTFSCADRDIKQPFNLSH
jgi:hypothetical protein